jgi:protein tyrosine/serine phosphatase
MVRRVFTVLLVTLVADAMPLFATAETQAIAVADAQAPIKRFMQVAPALYRGAQPDAEGFTFLRDLGIRTVVSFRNDDSERTLVEELGMRFVHIPVTFRIFGGEMPDDAAARLLAVLDDPAAGRVFVHCKRGADRTGAFVGLYRVLRQGWETKRAYEEAREIGMRWWYPEVKDELDELARVLGPPRVPATH